MVSRSLSAALGLLMSCWLPQTVLAIQVTPNSPCSSACVDSTSLDFSDPNSSNTRASDITCQDDEFGSSAGVKWESCMSCLQNSTFSQGAESDQSWFLYNMRYSLSYCVYNFLNASDVPDSPCVTQFACDPLRSAIEDGALSGQDPSPYAYCSVDGGVMSHENIGSCTSCVKASGDTYYLANYLVALDAGCQQKPEAGHAVALNGSVFSPTMIGIVNPATLSATGSDKSVGLTSAAIAGIVVGALAALLLAAALAFIRHKKRVNRRKRASFETKANAPWGPNAGHNMPTSPLSFQCQATMGPASPRFFPDAAAEEKEQGNHPPAQCPSPPSSTWKPHNATSSSSFRPISAVTEREGQTGPSPLHSHPTNNPNPHHGLHTLDTAIPLPAYPPPSSRGPTPLSSPQNYHNHNHYATPTSATSVRSTAPLLPYNPAEYAGPLSAGSSPSLRGGVWSNPVSQPRTRKGAKEEGGDDCGRTSEVARFLAGGRRREKDKDGGSPVESRTVGTSFPPPPPPPRR